MFYQKMLISLLSVSLCMASENTKPESPLTKEELIEIIKQIEKSPTLSSELLTIKFSDEPTFLAIQSFGMTSQKSHQKDFTFKIQSKNEEQQYYKNFLNCVNNNDSDCTEAVSALEDHWEHKLDQSFWKTYEQFPIPLVIKDTNSKKFYNQWLDSQKERVKNDLFQQFKSSVKKLLAFIQAKRLEK